MVESFDINSLPHLLDKPQMQEIVEERRRLVAENSAPCFNIAQLNMISSRINCRFPFVALSLLFALAQCRLIIQLLHEDYKSCADAALGVLTGHPHWIVYQNRVLGPWLIYIINLLVDNYVVSYMIFSIIMLTIAGYLASKIGQNICGALGGIMFFILLQLGFAIVMYKPLIYAWDFISLNVFLVIILLIQGNKSWHWFVALFAVSVFNRDDAMFIAFWLICEPISFWLRARVYEGRYLILPWPSIAAGFACVVVGLAVIHALRWALLVEEIGPKLWGHGEVSNANFHFQLYTNLTFFEHLYGNIMLVPIAHIFNISMSLMIPVFLLCIFSSIIFLAFKYSKLWLGLALVHLGWLIATLLFCDVNETRVYISFLPIIILASTLAVFDIKINSTADTTC